MTRGMHGGAVDRRPAPAPDDAAGRGLWRVLGGLVAGRTKVRLEREQRSTLELILREAPAGTVVDAHYDADRRLKVDIPAALPLRIYGLPPEPAPELWQPALEPAPYDR